MQNLLFLTFYKDYTEDEVYFIENVYYLKLEIVLYLYVFITIFRHAIVPIGRVEIQTKFVAFSLEFQFRMENSIPLFYCS